MLRIKDLTLVESREALSHIPAGKLLINTVNAHSYNMAQNDELFAEALRNGDYLIPDGASIVKACKWIGAKSQPKERIAGWDLFVYEMDRLNNELRVNNEESNGFYDEISSKQDDSSLLPLRSSRKKKVMFLGSSEKVLARIRQEASYVYHNIEVVTYSPPYKAEFSDEDNRAMVKAINDADPDLLWIGMTAPKQEKWTYEHWDELDIRCHVGTIGAVFDFFAGTYKRAPKWWQEHSLEWLYRLVSEPRRMWRRYVLGNPLFMWNIFMER